MNPFIVFVGRPNEELGGRYKLLEELGRGSFSVVWKAQRLSDKELVALKIPRDQELGEEVLRREPELMRSFNHPNIVKIYETCTIGGLFIIEMELVDGHSLADILDGVSPQKPLSFEQILHWTQQLLRGLVVIHRESVVHGDIKPQNILVNNNEQAKLVDFGTSHRLADVWVWTKGRGTELYWAPEVAFDEKRSLISDIYSLGVVLYEMITGTHPYRSPYVLLTKQKIQKPREINPDVPPLLEQIVERAMAHEPNERYPSAKAMLDDIEQALNSLSQLSTTQVSARTKPSRIGFRLDSSSPIYYHQQAISCLAKKDYQGALAAAEAAVERSGSHPNYLRLLASIYLRLDYQRRAISTYEKLLQVYEDSSSNREDQIADALERLAKLYLTNKRYRQAITAYKHLLTITTNQVYTQFHLAVAYGLNGQYRKSIKLLKAVRKERPDAAIVYSKLGFAYMADGDMRNGFSYYNQALVLEPSELTSLYGLARYHFIMGEKTRAKHYLERLRVADRLGRYTSHIRELEGY